MRFLIIITAFSTIVKVVSANLLREERHFLSNPALALESNAFSFSLNYFGLKPVEDLSFIPNFSNNPKPFWDLSLTTQSKELVPQRKIGAGFYISVPTSNVQHFRLFSPDEIYLLRHYDMDSILRTSVAGAIEVIPQKIIVGIGSSFCFTTAGASIVNISSNPTSELALNVGFTSSLNLGVIYISDLFRTGISYIGPIDPRFSQKVESNIRFSDSDLDMYPIYIEGSLFFEPEKLVSTFEYLLNSIRFGVVFSYEFWKSYKGRFLKTKVYESDEIVHETELNPPTLHNTLTFSVFTQLSLLKDKFSLHGKYRYMPTPISKNESNIVDSDSHTLGLGLEYLLFQYLRLGFSSELSLILKRHFYKVSDKYLWDFNYGGLAYTLNLTMIITL